MGVVPKTSAIPGGKENPFFTSRGTDKVGGRHGSKEGAPSASAAWGKRLRLAGGVAWKKKPVQFVSQKNAIRSKEKKITLAQERAEPIPFIKKERGVSSAPTGSKR